MTFYGITDQVPATYKPSSHKWKAHLRRYGKDESLIVTKILNSCSTLAEAKRWKAWHLNVIDQTKMINRPPKRLAIRGKNHPMFGKNNPKKYPNGTMKWYSNGYKTKQYIPGQEPSGWIKGRRLKVIPQAHYGKPCTDGTRVYPSVKEAAEFYGVNETTITKRIKRKIGLWALV